MKKIGSIVALGVFVVFMANCSPKSAKTIATEPVPTAEQMKAKYSEEQLAQGKTIWQNSCNRCHKLFEASSRTHEKWDRVLKRMIPKAKLTAEDGALVRAYLIAHSKVES